MTSIHGPQPGHGPLQQATQRHQQGLERLAAGRRIARAADDAAGLAIARRLEAHGRGLAQGVRNVAEGVGMVRTAEASLQQSHDALARLRELTVQARNGTLAAPDRAALQHEYDQLAAQVDQVARGAHYGDRALLDGSSSGAAAPVVHAGQGEAAALPLPDLRAASLGIAGRDVADPATAAALDAAVERVATARSQLGAAELGLQHRQAAVQEAWGQQAAARSRIEDADVAVEVAGTTAASLRTALAAQVLGLAQRQRPVLDLLLG